MKKKLFENVGGNQFRLVKEYNPEAWRGHEAPFDADPPESMDPESDPEYSVVEAEEEIEQAEADLAHWTKEGNYDAIERKMDWLRGKFWKWISGIRVKSPGAKQKLDDVWARYEKLSNQY